MRRNVARNNSSENVNRHGTTVETGVRFAIFKKMEQCATKAIAEGGIRIWKTTSWRQELQIYI